jgi:hypothetical protein
MYYIVELMSSVKVRVVDEAPDIEYARYKAERHSARTGLTVELQTELGRVIEVIDMWREHARI